MTTIIKHGTHGTYDKGCRCQVCRDFRATYVRNKRRQSGDLDGNARSRAITEAAARYREEHPLEWAQLLADHRSQLRYERGQTPTDTD